MLPTPAEKPEQTAAENPQAKIPVKKRTNKNSPSKLQRKKNRLAKQQAYAQRLQQTQEAELEDEEVAVIHANENRTEPQEEPEAFEASEDEAFETEDEEYSSSQISQTSLRESQTSRVEEHEESNPPVPDYMDTETVPSGVITTGLSFGDIDDFDDFLSPPITYANVLAHGGNSPTPAQVQQDAEMALDIHLQEIQDAPQGSLNESEQEETIAKLYRKEPLQTFEPVLTKKQKKNQKRKHLKR